MCEEFTCTPSVAERELDQHADLVLDVMAARAYARAKAAYDGADHLDEAARRKLLNDPLVRQVREIEFELAAEALKARTETDG